MSAAAGAMRVLRAADYRRMAWKNGGGETIEIAAWPPRAGLANFDWRVSMARVASDGPFSIFAGVDRTLCVLEGKGVVVHVEGRAPRGLTKSSAPFSFAGDARIAAQLIDGAVTDLNAMTRRDRFRHRVRRLRINGRREISATAAQALLFCHSGSAVVKSPAGAARLDALDALVFDDWPGGVCSIDAAKPSVFFLIELSRPGAVTA